MANSAHAVQSVLLNLVAYIKAQVPALTVLNEFPAANVKLTYPSLSVFSQPAKFTNHMPVVLATTTPVAGQVTATEDVGEYDLKMQLDLWTRTKPERDTILGQVLDAINAAVADTTGNNNSMGLQLQLADYFNEWARYDIDGHQYLDDEAAAQRQERRVKIDVLANVRAIRQRTYYAMSHIQANVGAETQDSQMTDDTTATDLNLIF